MYYRLEQDVAAILAKDRMPRFAIFPNVPPILGKRVIDKE